MGKKLALSCPHCHSQKIKRNGHHYGKKLQFFCHSCGKYFSEDVAKGYPISKTPFPVIAYLLYFRKKIPAFSNMREYRKFVSQLLKCIGLRDTDVDRHTIRHWLKNYESVFEEVISFNEARDFVHGVLSENLRGVSKEVIRAESRSHSEALHFLEQTLGKKFCVELARHDPVFFNELIDIVSKQQLYCHRLVGEFDQPYVGGLFFRGVVG